jgi:Domain of unknown function (DUF4145)
MLIDYDTIKKRRIDGWPCPHCGNGILKAYKNKIHREETKPSKSIQEESGGQYPYSEYYFSGLLKCVNCSEHISVIGNADDYAHAEEGEQSWYFYPKLFYPPLLFFSLSSKFPKKISNEIKNSFLLFWADCASSANRVRTVVELIMNAQKIKKSFISKKGKRRYYSLHERIEFFQNLNPKKKEIGQYFMAIKWIGNEGSHPLNELKQDDIIEAFEMLEAALIELYPSKHLVKLAKAITKRKGKKLRKKAKRVTI